MNKRLQTMIDNLLIPNRGGCFIDAYNQSINEEIAGTITTRVDASNMSFVTEPKIIEEVIQVRNIVDDTDIGFKNPQRGRIYSSDGLSPCLCDGSGGGGREPKIIEPQVLTPKRTDFGKQVRKQYESGELDMSRHDMTELEPRTDGVSNTLTSVQKDNLVAEPLRIPQATKQGYIEIPPGSLFDASYPNSTTRRGRVQEGGQVSPTLMAGGEAPCHYEGKESTSYRIRKLTPRECFRLMDVDEKNIDKIIASGVSNSQQYKMAGNSIVTNCMYHLFRKLFIETQTESQQLSLF